MPDPCRDLSCPPGQVCRAGACRDDICLITRCPANQLCEIFCIGEMCSSRCVPDWSYTYEPPPEGEGEGEGAEPGADAGNPDAGADAAVPPGPRTQDDGDGDPGCSCRAASPAHGELPGGLVTLLLLGLAGAAVRRG